MALGRKTGGRKPGSMNKTTATVKAALTEAFERLGGVPALQRWAKSEPTEFYKLWAKMLPVEPVGLDLRFPDGIPVVRRHIVRDGRKPT